MTTKHVMVDLETGSSQPNAAILAIGAVVFDPDGYTPETGSGFYTNVDLQSCIDGGLHVSGSTFMWWIGQSEDARKALTDPTPVALDVALRGFAEWLQGIGEGDIRLWSHATFDAPILSNAYAAIGIRQPWKYWQARDVRTIYELGFGDDKPPVPDDHPHHALWDAWRQAIGVQMSYRRIREKYVVPNSVVTNIYNSGIAMDGIQQVKDAVTGVASEELR